ncbi:MAG: thiolase family protein [Anaerolineales bacterium]|nr:thiolase family protein [Anaerolineales bacterium]
MSKHDPVRDPVILSAARTPVGRFLGALRDVPAPRLGAVAISAAVERAGIAERAEEIGEVLMGNVVSAGLGQAPARQAAIYAGLPPTVGATTLNKVCGSGLKACMLAAQSIRAGDGSLFVAGGMENMSRAPHLIHARGGDLRYGHDELTDALLHDGLWDPFVEWAMGSAAEWIAEEFEVTREAMDRYALRSHQRAVQAEEEGVFEQERVPVPISNSGSSSIAVEQDETPRPDTSLEKLAALKPAFHEDGRVTAGNAPGLNDGAAALVISSRSQAEAVGATPLARIVGYNQVAVPPREMFTAPALVIPKLLNQLDWELDEVDLLEVNEAFAAQILANGYALSDQGWDWDKVNVHGGAIALGHPLGASGAKILTTLIYALKRHGGQRGMASLCLGGGEAVALAVEIE